MRDVRIRGAAMTRFGRHLDRTCRDLAQEALRAALLDAGLDVGDVQGVFAGNAVDGLVHGQEAIRSQVALRGTGLLGVPIVNVENACASSSTALHLAWQSVACEAQDCVVVIGYEQLSHEDRARSYLAFNSLADLDEAAEIFGTEGSGRSGSMSPDAAASCCTAASRAASRDCFRVRCGS